MGKGDKRRPRQVPREEYEERWDKIDWGSVGARTPEVREELSERENDTQEG